MLLAKISIHAMTYADQQVKKTQEK